MLAELRRLLRPHATPAARQRSRSEGAEGLFEYPIAVKARVSARKWIPASEWLQLARASALNPTQRRRSSPAIERRGTTDFVEEPPVLAPALGICGAVREADCLARLTAE
jgi:hypothetical protein